MHSDIKVRSGAGFMIIALVLCLLIPSARIPLGGHAYKAAYHGRSLASFPQSSGLILKPEAYFRDFQNWYDDRVGFALLAGWARRRVSYYVFKDSPAPNIVLGKSGMIFLSAHSPVSDLSAIEHSCPPAKEWPVIYDQVEADWRRIEQRFRREGLTPHLLIFPSKKALYAEQLPDKVPASLRQRCRDIRHHEAPIIRLSEAFPGSVLDAYPVLQPHKNTRLFYPAENFHADGEAAIRSVDAVVRQMRNEGDGSSPLQQYRIEKSKSDLSHVMGFSLPNFIRQLPEFGPSSLQIETAFERSAQSLLGEPVWSRRYRNPDAMHDEKVMLITNSFGVRAAPYFARHFSQVDIVSTNRIRGPARHQLFYETLVFNGGYNHIVFVLHDESVFKHRLAKLAAGLE